MTEHRPAFASPIRGAWLSAVAVTGALLFGAWPTAYFFVNGSLGQAAVRRSLRYEVPGNAVDLGAVQWGPHPARLALLGASVRDPRGGPAIQAEVLSATIDFGALWEGHLVLREVRAQDYFLELRWDTRGRFNLVEAFRSGPQTVNQVHGSAPPPAGPRLAFEGIGLFDGRVRLVWPDGVADFSQVRATGTVRLDPEAGLWIDADLTGGTVDASWPGAPHPTSWPAIRIDGYQWRGAGWEVKKLELGPPGAPAVSLAGRLTASQEPAADPLTLEVWGDLTAPELRWGPWEASGLAATLRGKVSPSSLPGVDLVLRDAHADRIALRDGPWVENVRVDHAEASLSSHLEGRFEGLAAGRVGLPEGIVERVRGRGELHLDISGGRLTGAFELPDGRVVADGQVSLQPLELAARYALRLGFEGLRGPPALVIAAMLPQELRPAMSDALQGELTFGGQAKLDAHLGTVWGFDLQHGTLRAGEALAYDGGRWHLPDAAPAAEKLP
jgi:hypothetical protein